MKIKTIEIQNFKGLRNKTIEFGTHTNIYGTNGIGKSTILDAYLWCITGKNSADEEAFDITPHDENGVNIDNLENMVKITYIDDIGKDKSIQRTRIEKRTKDGELTGFTTKYKINDVPIDKKKEFDEFIQDEFNGEHFKLLSNPLYFPNLDWKEQRNKLIEICDIPSDEDIAKTLSEKDEKFNVVVELFESGLSIEQRQAMLKASLDQYEKDKIDLPARIDENESNIIEVDEKSITDEIELLQKEIDEVRKKDQSLIDAYNKANESNQTIKDRLTQLNTKKWDVERKLQSELSELRSDKYSEHDNNKIALNDVERKLKDLRNTLSQVKQRKENAEEDVKLLLKVYHSIKSEEFVLDAKKIVCPTCNREYDNAEERVTELQEQFNLSKADRIASNVKEGKAKKADIDKFDVEIETIMNEMSKQEIKYKELSEKVSSFVEPEIPSIDKAKAASKSYVDIETEIKELESKLSEVKKETVPEYENIINANTAKISELNKQLGRKISNDETKDKIESLRAKLKNISQLEANARKEQDVYVQFNKEKMSIVEKSVNTMFDGVTVKLWDYHQNGNDKEICDIRLNGTKFKSASTAEKTNIGIHIINAYSKFWNESFPLYIDNRESIVSIPETDCQTINLYVDENSKELRTEIIE